MPNPEDIKHLQNIEAIKNVHDCVDRLEKRFESFISGLGTRMDDHTKDLRDHEKRIYLLERVGGWFLWVIGALAISTIGLGIAVISKLVIK